MTTLDQQVEINRKANAKDVKQVTDQAKGQGPLSPLEENGISKDPLKFPLEDHETELRHNITFRPFRYSRAHRKAAPKRITVEEITLPIPSAIGTGYGINWSTTDLGMIGKRVADNTEPAIAAIKQAAAGGATGFVDRIFKSVTDAVSAGFADKSGTQVAGELVGATAGRLALKAGISSLDSLSVGFGLAINPHIAMLFQGVGLRTHSFSYNFIARSWEESLALESIIKRIKVAMHPYYWQGSEDILNYPFMWGIEFSKEIKPHLFAFNTCVLQNFNVSYNGQGFPIFFEASNQPVNVTFEMSFTETEILTQDRILKEGM